MNTAIQSMGSAIGDDGTTIRVVMTQGKFALVKGVKPLTPQRHYNSLDELEAAIKDHCRDKPSQCDEWTSALDIFRSKK